MKKVLFLCTNNSCRSQMAEGLLRYLASDKFEAFSAGTQPTSVNPLSIKVMAELGINISKQWSKSVSIFTNQRFDYVITVCDNAQKTCPTFPGTHKKIHWSLPDPTKATGSEKERLTVFRKIRDIINQKIEEFIAL